MRSFHALCKVHDIRVSFREEGKGHSTYCVKGHDIIGFVSKRKGKLVPCMMSRGMTLGLFQRGSGRSFHAQCQGA